MLKRIVYRLYERQLLAAILQRPRPRHLGLIQDGHRRYARQAGLSKPQGYHLGAAKAEEVLTWCAELGIPMVSLWWLSTENLAREPDEVGVSLFERVCAKTPQAELHVLNRTGHYCFREHPQECNRLLRSFCLG